MKYMVGVGLLLLSSVSLASISNPVLVNFPTTTVQGGNGYTPVLPYGSTIIVTPNYKLTYTIDGGYQEVPNGYTIQTNGYEPVGN